MPLKSKVAVPPTLCFSMSSEAFWVFVYVQVTASPGSRAMLARPVARSVVPFEQTRLVRAQPGTGRVSWIVLVPVASAPTKVKVRLFDVPDAGSSSRKKVPPWKSVPPPVPVVVKAKSWSASGTASLVTVMVASAVLVYVQVGVSPAVMTARTVVSPGSKPAVAPGAKVPPMPVPMVISAPLAVQTMFVSVQPGSGVSWTSLVPNWVAVKAKGSAGRGVGDRGIPGEGGREAGAGAAEVEGRGAAHALLLDVERGVLGVGVRAGDGVARLDGHAHGGVTRIEAVAAAGLEDAVHEAADDQAGGVARADDVRERPACGHGLGDHLGAELGGGESDGVARV